MIVNIVVNIINPSLFYTPCDLRAYTQIPMITIVGIVNVLSKNRSIASMIKPPIVCPKIPLTELHNPINASATALANFSIKTMSSSTLINRLKLHFLICCHLVQYIMSTKNSKGVVI